ncbi:MAG TPA: hypothetical protein ENI59_00150, partial [Euryarchaeota archaeon]|nr:hypothetical protein [Euryarchaeota archaeon]
SSYYGFERERFGSMGSRVSTALHLGYTKSSVSDPFLIFNILVSIAVANIPILMILAIGIFRFVFSGNYVASLIVIFTSGVIISLLLSISTVFIAVYTFRRGVDPDNVIGPLITSIADIITIPGIVLFVWLYETHYVAIFFLFIFSIVLFIYSIFSMIKYKISYTFRREIIKVSEILGIVCFLALIELVSGHFLESFSKEILKTGILSVLFPVILDTLGNYGSVIGARSATRYHLGALKRPVTKDVLYDIAYLASTSILNAVVMVTIALLFMGIADIRYQLGTLHGFLIVFSLTYFLISFVVMTIAVMLAYYSGKIGLDPDNITIPTITTIADLLGSIYVATLSILII